VRVGVDSLEGETPTKQELEIAEAIAHADYSAQTKYNDIALLKLAKPIKFDAKVRPACLNTKADLKWDKAIAIGFGKLNYENTETSKHLMKVQLSNIDREFCKSAYADNKLMTKGVIETQFCAGEKEGKKDTCQGDSGGALQTVLADPYCMYNIVGVTSFGKFCGFENAPGLYSAVAAYIGWVEEKVWG
jgi:secreted trypsin-like serine protease